MRTVMLVAGEASGDQHAANLFIELKKLIPGICGIGMGGQKMAEAGIDVRYDSSNIAVIGLVEVLKHFGEIRAALKLMQKIACEEKPDLLVCIDYKEFNFKLATRAKRCGIKVLFYVSPQVWAWRQGRVKKYGEVIDMMAVIFPFEVPFYQRHDIPVRYVGHPSVDKARPTLSKREALRRFGLENGGPVIGLLPGSRGHEIRRMLPIMLEAAERLSARFPTARFILPQAATVSDALLGDYLGQTKIPVRVLKDVFYDAVQCCDAVITTSGTATLELALLGVPMAITYRVAALTYLLGRRLIKIPYIGLPNIIAGRVIVKEFVQHDANAEALSAEIVRILTDRAYAEAMRGHLSQLKETLGEGGGSRNMAELVAQMLETAPAPTAA
ncbi:MAG: lipid-A-disaccharide synthase [Pseudomonadota bacterium]